MLLYNYATFDEVVRSLRPKALRLVDSASAH